MLKKRYSLSIQGKNHHWTFDVMVDPQYINEWRADGIIIEEIHNTIPVWIVDCGLTKQWCFFQDCFNFKNPFSRK